MSEDLLTVLQRREIAEILADFGLNDKEQRAYLALLPLGRTALAPLARAAGLPLTTAQSVMGRLVDRGLVRPSQRKTRRDYEALDPVVLRRLLERQAEEAAEAIPLLQRLRAAQGAAPKVRVYWRERVADVFHRALQARSKLVYEIVSAADIQEYFGEKFHFTRRRLKGGVRLRSLRVEATEIKKYSAAAHVRELREAKFLPRELAFRASVMFWDDTVAFFSSSDERLAWTVESPAVREMWRQLFDLLWSVSRKMETAAN